MIISAYVPETLGEVGGDKYGIETRFQLDTKTNETTSNCSLVRNWLSECKVLHKGTFQECVTEYEKIKVLYE